MRLSKLDNNLQDLIDNGNTVVIRNLMSFSLLYSRIHWRHRKHREGRG